MSYIDKYNIMSLPYIDILEEPEYELSYPYKSKVDPDPDEYDKLSQFIKNLNHHDPVIPDDFDPTVTVFSWKEVNKQVRETGRPTDEYLCSKTHLKEYAPMNIWIMYHPGFRVPDKLMYPVDLFRQGIGIVSPLSTWILYSQSYDIPEYLLDYLEVDRVKSKYPSCLMNWVEYRSTDIPDVLRKEIDYRPIYTELDKSYRINVAGTWMARSEPVPLPPDFHHLLDDFIDGDDDWLSNVVKFWLEYHIDKPVPDKFLNAIESRIDTFNYHTECVQDTLICHYRYYRPDEEVPWFLYGEIPFYELITDAVDEILNRPDNRWVSGGGCISSLDYMIELWLSR